MGIAVKKRGMAGKRGQVTLFIIIALILIAGAVSYFYLLRHNSNLDPLGEAKQAAETIARSDSVRTYVESCLEKVTQEAVLMVGRQGGYIYDYQMEKGIFFLGPGGNMCGSFPPGTCDPGANIIPYQPDSQLNSRVDNVSFLVKPNSNLAFPFYPYIGNLHAKDQPDTFGVVVGGETKGSPLELCELNGPNARDTEGAKHTCFNSYSSRGKSIQAYMQNYIAEKLTECADFSGGENYQGATIEAENATVDVVLGETDLFIKLYFRLKIRLPSKQATTTIAEYSYNMQDIRLKSMYELAYHVVKEDNTNIFFDKSSMVDLLGLDQCMSPVSQFGTTLCYKEGMNLTIVENPCLGCTKNLYADIIQIRDEYSFVDGEPYIFQFAVANRPPALDYISYSVPDTTTYHNYLSSIGKTATDIYHQKSMHDKNNNQYDIIVGKADTLEIYPLGADPDENLLTYRYVPLEPDTETAQKLEDSGLYQGTKRDVSVDAGSLGIGPHFVRLTVSDGGGQVDWQDLKIMVCDPETPPVQDPPLPLPEFYCT